MIDTILTKFGSILGEIKTKYSDYEFLDLLFSSSTTYLFFPVDSDVFCFIETIDNDQNAKENQKLTKKNLSSLKILSSKFSAKYKELKSNSFEQNENVRVLCLLWSTENNAISILAYEEIIYHIGLICKNRDRFIKEFDGELAKIFSSFLTSYKDYLKYKFCSVQNCSICFGLFIIKEKNLIQKCSVNPIPLAKLLKNQVLNLNVFSKISSKGNDLFSVKKKRGFIENLLFYLERNYTFGFLFYAIIFLILLVSYIKKFDILIHYSLNINTAILLISWGFLFFKLAFIFSLILLLILFLIAIFSPVLKIAIFFLVVCLLILVSLINYIRFLYRFNSLILITLFFFLVYSLSFILFSSYLFKLSFPTVFDFFDYFSLKSNYTLVNTTDKNGKAPFFFYTGAFDKIPNQPCGYLFIDTYTLEVCLKNLNIDYIVYENENFDNLFRKLLVANALAKASANTSAKAKKYASCRNIFQKRCFPAQSLIWVSEEEFKERVFDP